MDERARAVREMFTTVAPRYDFLNHLLSLNFDRRWRIRAAQAALEGFERPHVLDLCAGTGDLALELARQSPQAHVVALDFVEPMLRRAAAKAQDIARIGRIGHIGPIGSMRPMCFCCGDALQLPFPDGSFDALTVAFGLRNLSPIEGALGEMARVIRTGGRVVILEFALPQKGLWRRIYSFYFFRILPKVVRWISGTSAYSYLPASVILFPEPSRLSEMLGQQGLGSAQWKPLSGGTVGLYVASK